MARIRAVGAGQMIVLDPSVTRNVGYNGDRRAVDRDYAQASVEAGEQKGVLWIGEYGGVVSTPAFLAATELFLRHSLEEQEERFVGSVG